MPNVVDRHGSVVFRAKSDAEAVRWWNHEGEMDDRLEDTGELVAVVAQLLDLEEED